MSVTIDAREAAPLSSSQEMYVNKSQNARYGGTASGIPAEISGFWEAYRVGGRLPWKELFQPSVDLCINGFRLAKSLSKVLSTNEAMIKARSSLSELFINKSTGSVYKQNDLIKLTKLGNTLKIIGEQGPSAFYNGVLTGFMISEINENGLH